MRDSQVSSKRPALPGPERLKRLKLDLKSESGAEYSFYEAALHRASVSDTADVACKFEVRVTSEAQLYLSSRLPLVNDKALQCILSIITKQQFA
jgi:hypothetical protein